MTPARLEPHRESPADADVCLRMRTFCARTDDDADGDGVAREEFGHGQGECAPALGAAQHKGDLDGGNCADGAEEGVTKGGGARSIERVVA